jgi:hypothetical protein
MGSIDWIICRQFRSYKFFVKFITTSQLSSEDSCSAYMRPVTETTNDVAAAAVTTSTR